MDDIETIFARVVSAAVEGKVNRKEAAEAFVLRTHQDLAGRDPVPPVPMANRGPEFVLAWWDITHKIQGDFPGSSMGDPRLAKALDLGLRGWVTPEALREAELIVRCGLHRGPLSRSEQTDESRRWAEIIWKVLREGLSIPEAMTLYRQGQEVEFKQPKDCTPQEWTEASLLLAKALGPVGPWWQFVGKWAAHRDMLDGIHRHVASLKGVDGTDQNRADGIFQTAIAQRYYRDAGFDIPDVLRAWKDGWVESPPEKGGLTAPKDSQVQCSFWLVTACHLWPSDRQAWLAPIGRFFTQEDIGFFFEEFPDASITDEARMVDLTAAAAWNMLKGGNVIEWTARIANQEEIDLTPYAKPPASFDLTKDQKRETAILFGEAWVLLSLGAENGPNLPGLSTWLPPHMIREVLQRVIPTLVPEDTRWQEWKVFQRYMADPVPEAAPAPVVNSLDLDEWPRVFRTLCWARAGNILSPEEVRARWQGFLKGDERTVWKVPQPSGISADQARDQRGTVLQGLHVLSGRAADVYDAAYHCELPSSNEPLEVSGDLTPEALSELTYIIHWNHRPVGKQAEVFAAVLRWGCKVKHPTVTSSDTEASVANWNAILSYPSVVKWTGGTQHPELRDAWVAMGCPIMTAERARDLIKGVERTRAFHKAVKTWTPAEQRLLQLCKLVQSGDVSLADALYFWREGSANDLFPESSRGPLESIHPWTTFEARAEKIEIRPETVPIWRMFAQAREETVEQAGLLGRYLGETVDPNHEKNLRQGLYLEWLAREVTAGRISRVNAHGLWAQREKGIDVKKIPDNMPVLTALDVWNGLSLWYSDRPIPAVAYALLDNISVLGRATHAFHIEKALKDALRDVHTPGSVGTFTCLTEGDARGSWFTEAVAVRALQKIEDIAGVVDSDDLRELSAWFAPIDLLRALRIYREGRDGQTGGLTNKALDLLDLPVLEGLQALRSHPEYSTPSPREPWQDVRTLSSSAFDRAWNIACLNPTDVLWDSAMENLANSLDVDLSVRIQGPMKDEAQVRKNWDRIFQHPAMVKKVGNWTYHDELDRRVAQAHEDNSKANPVKGVPGQQPYQLLCLCIQVALGETSPTHAASMWRFGTVVPYELEGEGKDTTFKIRPGHTTFTPGLHDLTVARMWFWLLSQSTRDASPDEYASACRAWIAEDTLKNYQEEDPDLIHRIPVFLAAREGMPPHEKMDIWNRRFHHSQDWYANRKSYIKGTHDLDARGVTRLLEMASMITYPAEMLQGPWIAAPDAFVAGVSSYLSKADGFGATEQEVLRAVVQRMPQYLNLLISRYPVASDVGRFLLSQRESLGGPGSVAFPWIDQALEQVDANGSPAELHILVARPRVPEKVPEKVPEIDANEMEELTGQLQILRNIALKSEPEVRRKIVGLMAEISGGTYNPKGMAKLVIRNKPPATEADRELAVFLATAMVGRLWHKDPNQARDLALTEWEARREPVVGFGDPIEPISKTVGNVVSESLPGFDQPIIRWFVENSWAGKVTLASTLDQSYPSSNLRDAWNALQGVVDVDLGSLAEIHGIMIDRAAQVAIPPTAMSRVKDTLKTDVKEIALRTSVRRFRAALQGRLASWWVSQRYPRLDGENEADHRARTQGLLQEAGGFLGTDTGEAILSLAAGMVWEFAGDEVKEPRVRAFGDAVAREMRVSAGTTVVDGFIDEVLTPAIGVFQQGQEAILGATGIRVESSPAPAMEEVPEAVSTPAALTERH